jgi:hypothetical protein
MECPILFVGSNRRYTAQLRPTKRGWRRCLPTCKLLAWVWANPCHLGYFILHSLLQLLLWVCLAYLLLCLYDLTHSISLLNMFIALFVWPHTCNLLFCAESIDGFEWCGSWPNTAARTGWGTWWMVGFVFVPLLCLHLDYFVLHLDYFVRLLNLWLRDALVTWLCTWTCDLCVTYVIYVWDVCDIMVIYVILCEIMVIYVMYVLFVWMECKKQKRHCLATLSCVTLGKDTLCRVLWPLHTAKEARQTCLVPRFAVCQAITHGNVWPLCRVPACGTRQRLTCLPCATCRHTTKCTFSEILNRNYCRVCRTKHTANKVFC